MKKLILPLFILLVCCSYAQLPGFSVFANFDIPDKHKMPKMSTAFGAGYEFMYQPCKKSPLYITGVYSGGYYANKTINTTYYFSDGTTTKTDVQYSSALNKFMLGFRLIPQCEKFPLVPYLSFQSGMTRMKSRIYIEDPSDPDGCKPLEKRNVFSRNGFIYMAGGGLQFNTDAVRNKTHFVKNHIDLGFYFTGGPPIEYINIKHMKDEAHGPAHPGTSSTPSERDYYARFVNVSSNNIHDHKIAEVYTTPMNMWTLRIGYTLLF